MEPCGYGGIGRRSGLRIRCLRRGGSSPFSRTRPSAGGIRSETVVVPRIVRKKKTDGNGKFRGGNRNRFVVIIIFQEEVEK